MLFSVFSGGRGFGFGEVEGVDPSSITAHILRAHIIVLLDHYFLALVINTTNMTLLNVGIVILHPILPISLHVVKSEGLRRGDHEVVLFLLVLFECLQIPINHTATKVTPIVLGTDDVEESAKE